MVICLEQGADLHMAQLMPLPLTGFTFLVRAHLGSPGKRAVRRVCMYGMKNLTSVIQSILFANLY